MKSRFPVVFRRRDLCMAAACIYSLLLASCGGGSGDDNTPAGGDGSLVVDGSVEGAPADDVDTSVLLRKAATGSSASLGKNITSLQRIGGNSSSMRLLLDNVSLDSLDGLSGKEPGEESITSSDVLDTDLEADIGSFIETMLGLDDQTATITRTGNHLSIDPDDAALCNSALLDSSASNSDMADCQSLVSNLLVEVEAMSEESGLITVTFAQQELLLVGYAPTAVNYEIKLAAVQTLLSQVEQLDGESGSVPAMQGAVRISATLLDDAVNAESGTFSIRVTEALSITDNAGTHVSLSPSTLMSVTSDAATNSGSMEIDIGALDAISTTDDGLGGLTTSALAFSGLTARMDISNNGDSLQVSNVGIGNGPLTVSVDSVEQVRLMLATFGFSIEGETGTVTLNDALDFALSLAQTSTLSAQAPSGTTFVAQNNGPSQVSQGGPLVMSITGDDAGAPVSDSVSIGSGECFSATDDMNGYLPFAIVDCDW